MLSKNFSAGFLTTSSKANKKKSLALNPTHFHNNLTIIAGPSPQKIKTIKMSPKDVYRRINNNINNKKHKNIKSAKIYLRLEEKDEIEKIISEEERKRYFNHDFHLNQNINREELRRRIGKKIPFNEISKKSRNNNSLLKNERPKTTMKKNAFDRSRNLISINRVLFQNFKSQGESEIELSKKNLDMVNDFLRKMEEEKMKKYNEMEKKFLKNKSLEEDKTLVKENILKEKNDKIKKLESLKIKESDFIKFKKKQMIKDNKYLKQKSRIFDNILRYDFRNYYAPKNEDSKHQAVNYRLLSRTILMRNLMKQMKIAVYKDETLNVLRGFQSLKIANLSNDKYNLDSQDIYTNQNDNLFFFGNNMRHKPIPHFLKVKFSKKTSRKFGEINGSYFGLPV